MKIAQALPEQAKQKSAPRFHNVWKRIRASWVFQVGFLLLAFVAGAVVYRSGIVRPVTLFIRQVITQGPQSIKLPGPAAELAKDVKDEVRLYVDNGLPTLYIDMKFKDYQKVLAKRDEALKIGILNTTDADLVPAKVHLADGPEMNVKMRLKGDWTDHLQKDKWSFRIDIKDDNSYILSLRQFSIQTPETRGYLSEWAFHQNLLQEGVLTTRYEFVNVLLNGKLLGIYALEEFFAPEMIESQGRRQGVLLRFNEDLFWENLTNFYEVGLAQEGDFMTTNITTADITPFEETKIAKNPDLAAQAETARNLLYAFQTGQRPASEVFDVNVWGRFFALSDLWDACHGAKWHNIRFFYNPITGLLEPVAYDSEPFRWCNPGQTIAGLFIQNKMFSDPLIRAAYAREMVRISQKSYLADYKKRVIDEHNHLRDALLVEYPGEDVVVPWETLQKRQLSISRELHPAQPVKGSFQVSGLLPDSTEKPTLYVDLVNLMILPVEVVGVDVNGQALPIPAEMKPMTLKMIDDPYIHDFKPVRFSFPLQGIDLPTDDPEGIQAQLTVNVVVRLAGVEQDITIPLSGVKMPDAKLVGPLPAQPDMQQFVDQYPFLSNPNGDNMLVISSGTWDINQDLILPAGMDLMVQPGTQLRFAPGTILYATGAVNLSGTADAPVVITAQKDGWGGIVVLNAQNESTWTYAVVEKMAGISRDGWMQTGGINFYQSTINLDHVFIGNNHTEDGINVIHGVFRFHNSEFANTSSDAFDSDFSKGEVVDCYFHDIVGDALDVSGTVATVKGDRMERITDKGVSVGEQSNIRVEKATMDGVRIGVASKDLSKTVVVDSQIKSARFSALAAYIKKPAYGPASIEATNVTIQDTNTPAVCQTGNTIILNGKPVATQDLDVDTLYKQGVLGN